jgi:NitT/TauT family transport system substrate-binding protein
MNKIKALIFALLIIPLLPAFWAVKAAWGADDADYIVKIGYGGEVCPAPLYIAMEKGFLAAEGVRFSPHKYAHGAQFEALAARQVDVLTSVMENCVRPLANGLPAKITSGTHTGCMRIVTAKDRDINSLADLKGKRIGMASISAGTYMFTVRALYDAGVKAGGKDSEVEFVMIPGPELPLALERGAVDAATLVDPAAFIAVEEYGFITLVDQAATKPYADLICCVILVSDYLIAEHPELAAKVTRAIQRASLWVQENQDETAQIIVAQNYVPGTAEIIARILKNYDYSVIEAAKAREAFAVSVNQLKEIGVLGQELEAERFINNTFVFLPGVK